MNIHKFVEKKGIFVKITEFTGKNHLFISWIKIILSWHPVSTITPTYIEKYALSWKLPFTNQFYFWILLVFGNETGCENLIDQWL